MSKFKNRKELQKKYGRNDVDYAVVRDVEIPMRDGVILRADLFFPAENGKVDFNKKYPAVLYRSPYGRPEPVYPTPSQEYACKNGYVFVKNFTRGTCTSGGTRENLPLENEGWGALQDGVDTAKWLVAQPWSNGKFVTSGTSYMGATQVYLMLSEEVPGYVTSAIQVPCISILMDHSDEFFLMIGAMWAFGGLGLALTFGNYPEEVVGKIMEDNAAVGDLFANAEKLDLPKLIRQYGIRNVPIVRNELWWTKWVDLMSSREKGKNLAPYERKFDTDKPMLVAGGWYDMFIHSTLNVYEKLMQDAPNDEVKAGHRLVIGSDCHHGSVGNICFPGGAVDAGMMIQEWFDRQVKGEPNDFYDDNPVAIFVMGENRWRSEKCWPLTDAVRETLYFHSGGAANSSAGDGALSSAAPTEDETPDKMISDPNDPVPYCGGIDMYGGADDQYAFEKREDVLVYTSEALADDTEVTGTAVAYIQSAASTEDADIIVKLVDVDTSGNAINVASGARRGRFVKNGVDHPEKLEPGEILTYRVDLNPTSYVFKKGHKIRVDVYGSEYGRYDLNPHQYVDLWTATEKDYIASEQCVYHDTEHASRIELPVIPADRERNWIERPFYETGIDHIKAIEPQWKSCWDPYKTIQFPAEIDKSEME